MEGGIILSPNCANQNRFTELAFPIQVAGCLERTLITTDQLNVRGNSFKFICSFFPYVGGCGRFMRFESKH